MTNHRSNFREKAKTQIKDFMIMFFYLWVVFGLLAVHESFVLSQHRIDFRPHGLALINALIFAKVMLVAQDVHLGSRLNDRPLNLFRGLQIDFVRDRTHMLSRCRARRYRSSRWTNII